MNIIPFIFYLVVAPSTQPPLWIWVIIAVLMAVAVLLLAGSQIDFRLMKKKIN